MPTRRNNPFSPFADPDSFLGQPFLPKVGQAISDFGRATISALTPSAGTPPSTLAGVSVPQAGAAAPNLNPLPFLSSLNPFGNRPLIRTDFGERPATPTQAMPQLPSGATSYGMARPSSAIPVPFPAFPSQASVGASMVTAPSTTIPQPSQPAPIFPTPIGQQRVDTAVRSGTISATPQQLENLNARDTAYVGRTPEQQQALLAQVRAKGANLAARRADTMQTFADSRIPNRREMPAPQGRYGQPLTDLFPRSREAMSQARATVSPALPMASFTPPQPAAPFIEEQRNPFRSIYGFSV
jgi:hypothetical protein